MSLYVLALDGYKFASVISACCISENKAHEKCHCLDTDVSQCKEWCDQDVNCKGYVEQVDNVDNVNNCQMATTSDCPSQCQQWQGNGKATVTIGNVGSIDQHATCGSDIYQGCWIKGNIMSTFNRYF